MTNRKLHIGFRLAPRAMTFDDREQLEVQIFGEIRGIVQM